MMTLDSFTSNASPKRTRNPQKNELVLYEFISNQSNPVSFYDIEQGLKMTPGAVQATIKRCLREEAQYRIYETKIISTKTNRITRVFTHNPNLIKDQDPIDLELIKTEYIKLHAGELIEEKNHIILPLKLDKTTTKILEEICVLSPKIKNIGMLFSEAAMAFLKEKVPKDIIQAARKKLDQGGQS
jgi:hypothetical protein